MGGKKTQHFVGKNGVYTLPYNCLTPPQTVETTKQSVLKYEKNIGIPSFRRSPKSTTSPRGPVQFVELRGASAHICGLTECYVESIQEVRGGGRFSGNICEENMWEKIFYLGGGVDGKNLH